ncbi:hypothetical protein PENSPDRAFT_653112 [Peniophora sp. CONT]|nr:hypothetical protein PENSPDRAFT_653112 [Peniophora sp. CONT]
MMTGRSKDHTGRHARNTGAHQSEHLALYYYHVLLARRCRTELRNPRCHISEHTCALGLCAFACCVTIQDEPVHDVATV